MSYPMRSKIVPAEPLPASSAAGADALEHVLGLLRDTHVPITLMRLTPGDAAGEEAADLLPVLEARGFAGRLADGGYALLLIGTGVDPLALFAGGTPGMEGGRISVWEGTAADIGAPDDLLLLLATAPAGPWPQHRAPRLAA